MTLAINKKQPIPNIGRAQLIEKLCEEHGFDKKVSAQLVETILETMIEVLTTGQTLKFNGFASLSISQKIKRPGRNPRTQETVMIAPRRVVRLRTSEHFYKRLNHEI